MIQSWRYGSSKLLVIAVIAFFVSIQFKSAFRTLTLPTTESRYNEFEFEPPGARRWEGDAVDTEPDILLANNLRGDGAPTTQPHHEHTKDQDEPIPEKQISPIPRRVPRGIVIQYTWNGKLSVLQERSSHRSTHFKEDSISSDAPQIEPNWYEPNADEFIDGYDWDVCVPMYDWQLQSFPNCNKFHELDLQHMRVINTGGSRIALEMKHIFDGRESKFVYKTVKWKKSISTKLAEEQRKDSIVMERTSSSQFIPDMHGYCSLAVMMDFMPEGSMHDYIKGARLAGGSTLPPVDRLKLSIHVASSVADLHTIDDTPMPSLFHNDLCCHQYLFQNGIFKLNDFNYARPIYKNKETNEQCVRNSFNMQMWKARSLEEMQLNLQRDKFRPPKPDKVDVWMMGNIIYYMLTDLYTFEKPQNLSWRDSGRELLAGRRSPYPEHIAKSKDPAHVAVKQALDMCWVQKWQERPSARSISDYLMGQLKEITGEENPDVRVVLPERDPNQGSSESD
eukprot:CAMPEP_0181131732 /NCGR_PEP_ID=MMETSP1071-20121207/30613_1 /TAXON_ID=35127 /ORGANISM="Thalassiosira sp., Strain NH16" /LENGTH=505 /DNA_ID=CAMNT_0023218007 /DNA_START=76 /DNA_END=1590 /DNA_ORIENTATION=+